MMSREASAAVTTLDRSKEHGCVTTYCLRFSLVGVSACQADVGGIVTRLGRHSGMRRTGRWAELYCLDKGPGHPLQFQRVA